MMVISFFSFIVIINRLITVIAWQACSSGQSEYDGSCYQLAPGETDFYSSKSSCEDLGMHLVYIGSQEEQDFLVNNVVGDKEYWIGLSSVTWLDGSPLTYHNMPDHTSVYNHGVMCFRLYPSAFFWYDGNCLIMDHYICEKEECNSDDSDSQEYDHSCYHFSQSVSDFYTSKSHCEDLGMHLVYIGSQNEQEFLVNNVVTSRRYWIGLSSFTWLDQSRLTYQNFGLGSFDGQEGTCFYMKASDSFRWVYEKCSLSHDGICEKELETQTSSVQHTKLGSTTSPGGSGKTTSIQLTAFETSISTIKTDIATSGSTRRSTTTGGVVSETTDNPTSTRPTSEETSASTTGQGSTASEQATDTTPAVMTKRAAQTTTSSPPLEKEIQTNSVQHTKQRATTSPDGSTETTPDQGTHSKTAIPSTRTAYKKFKKFKLVADNTALVDAYVRSSHSVFSLIGCSQRCFADTHCSCFIVIECEGLCLLAGKCPAMSTDAYERRPGAKLYSAS